MARLFFLLLICTVPLNSSNKISLLIPCRGNHIQLLSPLLENLCDQTRRPDEVVISISENKATYEKDIDILSNCNYPFDLEVITSAQVQFAGVNRNICMKRATGDLLIFNDADDTPHPQRIELIEKAYDATHFDCLVHTHYLNGDNAILSGDKVSFYMNKHYDIHNLSRISRSLPKFMHSGNCAITKSLAERYSYGNAKQGQDRIFIHQFFRNNEVKFFYLNEPLIIYNQIFSSHHINMNPVAK